MPKCMPIGEFVTTCHVWALPRTQACVACTSRSRNLLQHPFEVRDIKAQRLFLTRAYQSCTPMKFPFDHDCVTACDVLVVACRRQLHDPILAGSGAEIDRGAFFIEKCKFGSSDGSLRRHSIREFSALFLPVLSYLIVKSGSSDHPSHVPRLSLVRYSPLFLPLLR
jgi:hypothetical protein